MRYVEDGWLCAESGAVIRSGPADLIRCPERSPIQTMEPRRIALAVALLQALASSLVCVFAWRLGRALHSERVGRLAALGWAYVGLRIVHSLVQALWNRIAVRFLLFVLSSIALIALVLHLVLAVFGY